jgi:hypothetical protein
MSASTTGPALDINLSRLSASLSFFLYAVPLVIFDVYLMLDESVAPSDSPTGIEIVP